MFTATGSVGVPLLKEVSVYILWGEQENTLCISTHRVIHDVWWCRNTACTRSKERYEAHSQGTIEASNNKICLGVHLPGIFLPQPCSVPCELPVIRTVWMESFNPSSQETLTAHKKLTCTSRS